MNTAAQVINLELFSDLATRRLVSRDGSQMSLAPITAGDRLRCTVRALAHADAGDTSEVELPVRSLRASIGATGAPPTSGSFKVRGLAQRAARGGRVVLSPTVARWFTGFYTGGGVSDPGTEYALSDVTFAGSANEAGALGVGIVTAGLDENGNAFFEAVDPTAQISVVYTNNAPDNPDADFQPSTVVGNPTPAGVFPADSEPISFNESPETFLALVGAVSMVPITAIEKPTEGCWLFRALDGSQISFSAGAANRLDPISFVRCRTFERFSGQWWVEVCLMRAPLAFNVGFERVLPPAPSVARIRPGDPGTDTQPPVNELQAVYLPPGFAGGTYFLRWNYRVTRVLGKDDEQDEIAEALNAMFDDSKQRFVGTNPALGFAYIEFVGDLAGSPQPLITVEVSTLPAGVPTFEIPLDRAEMFAAMRGKKSIKEPFEVEVELGDLDAPEVPGRVVTLFAEEVTIVNENIFRELAVVQPIDWQTPPSARDYVPFTRDQVISGVLHYTAVFGNGAARSFSLAHNLGTDALHLTVRENFAGGRVLVPGLDYSATIPSASEVVVEIPLARPVPLLDSLAVVISTAGPVSAFLAHTHTLEQIVGLVDLLSQVQARLESLEDLLPTPQLARREIRPEVDAIEIPSRRELYPLLKLPDGFSLAALDDANGVDESKLPRPSPLLPALHVAATIDLPGALPALTGNAGKVYKRTSATPLVIPGGGGRRSTSISQNEFVGTDGRFWYALSRAGTSNSYFPRDLERELFVLNVNDAQWQPGESISLEFAVELQLLRANTGAQMVVVIEAGTAPGQTTPAPVDPANLERITWAAAPMLAQRVVVSPVRTKHKFGVVLKRSISNEISGERLNYTAWTAAPAPSLPTAPGVVLRARLVQFDTENPVAAAAGLIFYAMHDASATIG